AFAFGFGTAKPAAKPANPTAKIRSRNMVAIHPATHRCIAKSTSLGKEAALLSNQQASCPEFVQTASRLRAPRPESPGLGGFYRAVRLACLLPLRSCSVRSFGPYVWAPEL